MNARKLLFVLGMMMAGPAKLLDVSELPSAEDIQKAVNRRYDALHHVGKDGTRRAHVCVVCDEFIRNEDDKKRVTVKALSLMKDKLSWESFKDPRRTKDVEEYYSLPGDILRKYPNLKGMALSPRGFLHKTGNQHLGFTCCKRCSGNITRKTLPRHAIVNSNYVGAAPKCLMELTEVELAFLTPVKHYGFCLTFTGGEKRNLKGTLSFMRIEKRSIATAVATLDDLGFNDSVLVLYTGRLTPWQKKRADELCKVRTEKIITALEWLCENHWRWKEVDYPSLVAELSQKTPIVIDRSKEAESANSNVEEQEIFSCFYPDGAATPANGGYDKAAGFKHYVQLLAEEGYNVEFQANLHEEYVRGDDRDVMVDCCLLQFPHGIGGIWDRRRMQDGSFSRKADMHEYLDHLSRKADRKFQRPLFQLVQYSLVSKKQLLTSSRLQLRGKTDAKNLAEGLNSKDVTSCITGRRLNNRHAGTTVSRRFLDAVDATAKNLAHTNEASKAARGKGEAMQHHFGMSSVFLTVTFDDENSLLVQVLSGIRVDDDKPVSSLSDEEVSDRAKKRKSLRVEYPGIAALNFEMLYDILLEEVIGWDKENNCALKGKGGFFGVPYALSAAVEEQGRKTLHAHMTMWIKGFKEVQKALFFGTSRERKEAERTITKYSEHVSSTTLFGEHQTSDFLRAFDHECPVERRRRRPPVTVGDQMLRNLRNRWGYRDFEGRFASCPHAECGKWWTYEDLICGFIRDQEGLEGPTGDDGKPVIPKARLLGKIIEYQKSEGEDPPKTCINAVCQHHLSCHVSGCFRCQKKGFKKRGHVCGAGCECRYRLPDKKRMRATVLVDQEAIKWYLWDGHSKDQPLAQVLPQRKKYDLFQNVSCPAISHSKFTCNNNVAVILDGPIGQYIHKYQQKPNQEEEGAEYKEVEASIKRFDSDSRVHDQDRPEALRRICRGAFAHNKKNVISPCFASYLTRHKSRFYFSHEFKYCHLKDVVKVHNDQEVKGMLKYCPDGSQFFENGAIDYLCRHKDLEDVSLARFTEEYYMTNTTVDEDNDVLSCIGDTGYLVHPSVRKNPRSKGFGKCARGAGLRDEAVLFRVTQWMFPDTATFKGDLFKCGCNEFNKQMEIYAQLVLCLFMPHRRRKDLVIAGYPYPHVSKIRAVYWQEENMMEEDKVVFTARNKSFLQNLQDCRSNTLRYQIKDDAVTKGTEPYQSANAAKEEKKEEEEDDEHEESPYEAISELLEDDCGQPPSTDGDPGYLAAELKNFKFSHMRDKGRDGCGYATDLPAKKVEDDIDLLNNRDGTGGSSGGDGTEYERTRKKYSCKELVRLHLMRNRPKVKKTVWRDKTVKVSDATGSIKSVREWAKAAFGTDKKQQRAFEVLTASFLLTFYEESPEDRFDAATETSRYRSKYRQTKNALMRLRGCKKDGSLVCLLHGPGGSGKSTVINAVKAYAADYCAMLQHKFTNRTIIITAMSGVAATLLNGETTHSVLGLNRDGVQAEEVQEWTDARLMVIDECSFAAERDFRKMHEHLKCLMEESFRVYGGLNIVFAGDYSQLEPVNRDPIYKDNNYCPEFHGALNCYIELDGQWRFKDDPTYGSMMSRFRVGTPTEADIEKINEECHTDVKAPPAGIQVATYTNRDRDAVNAAVFEEYMKENKPEDGSLLKSGCVLFMDELYMNDSSRTPVPVTSNSVKRYFYENCTESECGYDKKARCGRVDPVLKLYYNCPLMLTQNKDVMNGEANGSRVFLEHIEVKTGEEPFQLKLDCGTVTNALFASQVKCMGLRHECEDISPQKFEVEAESFKFKTRLEVGTEELYVTMRGTQFAVISNSCTTGHKLQGCSVDSILANTWFYGANWVYVVLSRVRTMRGLYIRSRLSKDLKRYAKPKEMKEMLQKFRDTILVELLDDEVYEELLRRGEDV